MSSLWDFSDTFVTFDNPLYFFDGSGPGGQAGVSVPGLGKDGGNVVLDAKKASETLSFPFDFSSSLAVGETISSASASATVWSGVDPDVAFLVASAPLVQGSIVYQSVQGGIEGVTYVISVIAITSLSQSIEIDAFMSII